MDELDARVAELRTEFDGKLRRRTRIGAAVLGIALIVAMAPMLVLAATFGDVTNANPFYTDISRVSGAGIAAGCGNGNYCPESNVTREQMAAFLSRASGRVSFDSYTASTLADNYATVAAVQIKAGNVTGGTANVLITATIALNPSSASLPTGGTFQLLFNGDYLTDTTVVVGDVTHTQDNGMLQWVVAVPTGVVHDIALQAQRAFSTDANHWGTLTALYVPFDGDGTNANVIP